MRVTANYDLCFLRGRISLQLPHVVEDVDSGRTGLDQSIDRKSRVSWVDVALDGDRWSDTLQSVEDLGFTHVASMNDQVRAAQRVQDFGPQQPVGVGD